MNLSTGRLRALWRWLIKPSTRLQETNRQRQSQLLAGLLIIIGPVGLVVALFGLSNPAARALIGEPDLLLALGLCLLAPALYVLNRLGYVQTAARLMVYVSALGLYVAAVPESSPLMDSSLLRLLIPLLTGALFFSISEQIGLAAIILLAVLAYPLLVPRVTLPAILSGPFVFLLTTSALIVLDMTRARTAEAAPAVVSNQVDMSEPKRDEADAHNILHLLQSVLAHVPVIVWSADRNGVVTLAEGLALRRLGVEPHELIGQSLFEIAPPELDFGIDVQRALLGEAHTAFHQYRGVSYQTHFHPIYDAAGTVDGLVMVTVDISERTHAEQHQLDLALERERIDLLQRFMGDVSHDFKTPLTSIKLSLYLLDKVQVEADRQRHLNVIARQTDRLEKFINDLFNMSRLDQAITGEFDVGPVNINTLLGDVLMAHEPLIAERRHQTRFEPDPSLPETFGDRFQLERVFTNLLVNAINYTPDGGHITLRTEYRNPDVIIEVQDDGPGIPPEEHERIFMRFYRGDQARGSDTGGLGVGLSIARKIVEAHGGRIELDSAPGAGSTFRVTLPMLRT